METEPENPILVVVEDDNYYCFALSGTPTLRDLQLLAVLQQMGGIAKGTPDGRYLFNCERLDEGNAVASLEDA